MVLALLYIAKKTNDFREPRVYFVPHQLFQIMGWSPNSRSYDRLQSVLRRLKALTIRFENAWWDAEGREYEEEFATGIIAEYRILKAKSAKADESMSSSYVHWMPAFFKSLANDNIKKLDLDFLFGLDLPTTQRMYRFLDKRFYTQPIVEMDLSDFAFGHIGLTFTKNVAEVKRRLGPAIAELEKLGFITSAVQSERFKKVKKGIWRIRFEPGTQRPARRPMSTIQPAPLNSPTSDSLVLSPPARLVTNFYALWSPATAPSENAQAVAAELIERFGIELVESWLPKVIARLKQEFPLAKHFQAAKPFFEDFGLEHSKQQQRQQQLEEKKRQEQEQDREAARQQAADQAFIARWQPAWDALAEADREVIRSLVFAANPFFATTHARRQSHHVTHLCLEELARQRSEAPSADVADGPQTA